MFNVRLLLLAMRKVKYVLVGFGNTFTVNPAFASSAVFSAGFSCSVVSVAGPSSFTIVPVPAALDIGAFTALRRSTVKFSLGSMVLSPFIPIVIFCIVTPGLM